MFFFFIAFYLLNYTNANDDLLNIELKTDGIYKFHNAKSVLILVEILVKASLFTHSTENIYVDKLCVDLDYQQELSSDDIG